MITSSSIMIVIGVIRSDKPAPHADVAIMIEIDDGEHLRREARLAVLAAALSLDMAVCFTPTADDFFGRLTKDRIVETLQEARGAAVAWAWLKAKKADLAGIAEREVARNVVAVTFLAGTGL